MQIAQDYLSRASAENPVHSELCKGFSTGAVGRKDKQNAQVTFEQFLIYQQNNGRKHSLPPPEKTFLCRIRTARNFYHVSSYSSAQYFSCRTFCFM